MIMKKQLLLLVMMLLPLMARAKVYTVNLTETGTLVNFTQSEEAKLADSLVVTGNVQLNNDDFVAIKKLIVSYNVVYVDIYETLNTTIGSETFISCTKLRGFRFPKNLQNIGWYTFEYGSSLKDIYLPESLSSFGTGVFRSCGLNRVVIPQNVTRIEDQAFYYCPLEHIYLKPTTPPMCNSTAFYPQVTSIDNTILHVPEGTKTLYENADGWMYFKNIVETNANIIKLYVYGAENGYVFINNEQISNNGYSLIEEGKNVSVRFEPFYGYMLESVMFNEKDITDQVKDNTLTLESIEQNSNLNVKFGKIKAIVTIKSGEGGIVRHQVPINEPQKYTIEALEGWEISYIGFNGNDVTNYLNNGIYKTPNIIGDSELVTIFKNNEASNVRQNQFDQVKVSAANGTIYFNNSGSSVNALIYKTNGELVKSLNLSTGNSSIHLMPDVIYIIRIDDSVYKIAL